MGIRSFLAFELPLEIKDIVARVSGELRKSNLDLKWVKVDNIHLTVVFLGNVQMADMEAIGDEAGKVCLKTGSFGISLVGMGVFPNTRRPRVVWIGVDEPTGTLSRLQQDVEQNIAPLGFPAERRKFSPHLTLGRVKRGRSPAELEALGEYATRARVRVGEMEVGAVYLMRSDLRPTGALYTELAQCPLGGTRGAT